MGRIIGKRLALSLISIVGASFLAFVLMRVLPGNPARAVLGPMAPAKAVHALFERMGLDQPLYKQYFIYMGQFFRGDWGFSYTTGQPVAQQIAHRLPATVELAVCAFLFATISALVLALLVTYRRRPLLDRTVRGAALLGYGTPQFFVGIVLLLVFSNWLGVLPGPDGRLSVGMTPPPTVTGFYTIDALISGELNVFWNAIYHLILPSLTLGLLEFSFLVRLLRANLLEISREPFILVVRSKGMGRWGAFREHALRNAVLPTITAAGLILGDFLAGSVLVEKVFNWPGVGNLVANSIIRQDFSVVQAFILLTAVMYVLLNLFVDILYGVIDPRIRIGSVIAKN